MSSIQEYLKESTVFVTGFPGFLGKLMVHKILSCCPDVRKIYVLMRRDGHASVHDRLTHVLDSKIFLKLKEQFPDFTQKIEPLLGDITQQRLSLSADTLNKLADEVNIVINLAQSSKCDSQLREAVITNVQGTRNVLDICKTLKQLTSVVCLSSIFANCNHATISEIIYQPAVDPQKLLRASGWLDDGVFNDIEDFLTKGYANSFTYTKALMEYLIQQEYSDLPISIVRPAIIGATWREPFPGWIDSNTGLVPLVHSCGKGLLRVLRGSPKSTVEIIPADTVINTLLAVTWARYKNITLCEEGQTPNTVNVYNLINNAGRKLTWSQFEQNVCSSFVKNPLNDVVRIPSATMTKNRVIAAAQGFFRHTLWAYSMDLVSLLLARSPTYVVQTNQFLKALEAAEYFTVRDWKIENSNVKTLMAKLSSSDKKNFSLDTSCAHWPTYIEAMCLGIKQYVAGDSMAQLNQARKSIYRIRWAHRFWRVVQLLVLIRIASTKMEWARVVWTKILNLALAIYESLPALIKS